MSTPGPRTALSSGPVGSHTLATSPVPAGPLTAVAATSALQLAAGARPVSLAALAASQNLLEAQAALEKRRLYTSSGAPGPSLGPL